MKKYINLVLLLAGLIFILNTKAISQDISFQQYQNQGVIQIAEVGQLADTLNLWGDVRTTGKYLVPRGTNLIDLISYAKGPVGLTTNRRNDAWSRVNLQVNIQRYNSNTNDFNIDSFDLKLNEPLPNIVKNYPLRNGDVITIKANQKPTFRDYFQVIAPVISLGFTTFLFIDRVN